MCRRLSAKHAERIFRNDTRLMPFFQKQPINLACNAFFSFASQDGNGHGNLQIALVSGRLLRLAETANAREHTAASILCHGAVGTLFGVCEL